MTFLKEFSLRIYCVFALLGLVVACSTTDIEKESYIANKNTQIADTKKKIANYCVLTKDFEKGDHINIATIYFDKYKSNLDKNSLKVITDVYNIYNKCFKTVIILGNISDLEHTSLEQDLGLSINRARSVYKQLKKLGIKDDNYITMLGCSNMNLALEENSKNASTYNQRVDIIFSNISVDAARNFCLFNK